MKLELYEQALTTDWRVPFYPTHFSWKDFWVHSCLQFSVRLWIWKSLVRKSQDFIRGDFIPYISYVHGDVPTVRVSFSGSSVLNRVYNFTFSCLKQSRPRKSPFLPLRSHDVRWFRAPPLKCVKTRTYVPFFSVFNTACLVQSWTE